MCIEVDKFLPPLRVIRALGSIIEGRGKPGAIRFDNGREYVAGQLMAWAKAKRNPVKYIRPGKPQHNAYMERYNRTGRYEWLGQHLFELIQHAQETATEWLWRYNNERPNMALGGITPIQKLEQAA